MARYNQKKEKVDTSVSTHEGGRGYQLTPKHHLVSILATGLDNTFYEKLGDRENRFISVLGEVAEKDVEFAAKALVYARSVMGQRTVTHLGAALLARYLSGAAALGSAFFSKRSKNKAKKSTGGIIYRLDDALEIASAYMHLNAGKPLSNAMKKGFKKALEAADEYELAKYQAKTRKFSLVDLVNLVHPKPSEKMAPVFEKLMKGELKQFNTVEDKNSKAGQDTANRVKDGEITAQEAVQELNDLKHQNYKELISTGTIGYLALLRNLRNIINVADNDVELLNDVCSFLTDSSRVRSSLVFPHQIDLALEVLVSDTTLKNSAVNRIVSALNTAYELAIPNLSELAKEGSTAIVFDSSGSMSTPIKLSNNKAGSTSALDKAALIAATLGKGLNADVYHFANTCAPIRFNPGDSVNTIKKTLLSANSVGGGTEFSSIFDRVDAKNYSRIFVISDMQGADSIRRHLQYPDVYVYSVDITGYGTTMFKPDSRVYSIYGYSADIYEMMKKVEIDYNAVLTAINEIVI